MGTLRLSITKLYLRGNLRELDLPVLSERPGVNELNPFPTGMEALGSQGGLPAVRGRAFMEHRPCGRAHLAEVCNARRTMGATAGAYDQRLQRPAAKGKLSDMQCV